MKLAFSTIGCPDWTYEDIFATAKDMGYDGIEIRGVGNELFAPKIRPFLPQNLVQTVKRLQSAGMEIPMLTSSACLGSRDGKTGEYVKESKDYIDLAQKLGTPFIRVLCSQNPQPDTEIDLDFLAEVYTEICTYGESRGVTPLIETNGFLADSAVMRKLLEKTGSKNRGVLWDIHHPFRFFAEKPEDTVSRLGGEIRYLHVKDSAMKDGRVEYRMMGYGDVPVLDALRALKEAGYDGYITLEWVKRWIPDLEEPGVVLAHYVNYMNWLFKTLS